MKKRGRIDLAARWVHNPKLVVPLPPELQASELHFDRPANEIQIFLVRAAGLPIMDKHLMSKGGSSDPVVSFECCGEKCVSSIKKKDLNPRWAEYHSLLVEEDDAELLVVVEDHDLMGAGRRPSRRVDGVTLASARECRTALCHRRVSTASRRRHDAESLAESASGESSVPYAVAARRQRLHGPAHDRHQGARR